VADRLKRDGMDAAFLHGHHEEIIREFAAFAKTLIRRKWR
jgi:hypothetical protein